MAHWPPAKARQPREFPTVGGIVGDRIFDGCCELAAHALVGIDGKNPDPGGQRERVVLLRSEAAPLMLLDASPFCRAMSTVKSSLPQSTTMISSQNASVSRQAPILPASFLVTTMALSCGMNCVPRSGQSRPALFCTADARSQVQLTVRPAVRPTARPTKSWFPRLTAAFRRPLWRARSGRPGQPSMRTVFPDTAEEALEAEFFAAERSGFFVEVGANDPQRGSQSLAARTARLDRDFGRTAAGPRRAVAATAESARRRGGVFIAG